MVWQMIALGRSAGKRQRGQRGAQLRHVVAVDLLDRETEGPPLVGQGLQVEHFVGRAVGLLLVVVEQHGEVAQAVLGRARAASQTEPSSHSPSLQTTNTRCRPCA